MYFAAFVHMTFALAPSIIDNADYRISRVYWHLNKYLFFFLFRWLTLMLSQEFALPDVLRIWDSVLSDETRSDFLIDVCTAMVLVIREDILTNDFAENMKLLQVSYSDNILCITQFSLADTYERNLSLPSEG